MNELTIMKVNGGAYIDSRDVADAIGKAHRHLLRDIRGYCVIIAKITKPNFGLSDFFLGNSYLDSTGRELPCYLLSKMGCEMVSNKLIGEKGVMFTAAYVAKFNAMETAEREAAIKAYTKPRLNEFNSAVRNVLNGMSYSYTKPSRVMNFLQGVYEPLGIEVIPFHETDYSGYYTVTEIAEAFGLYSESGRPHGHAVSAIISKIEDAPRHAVVIPYGLVGVTVRYNKHITESVMQWLIDNDFPTEVPYQDFEYHIYYKNRCPVCGSNDEDIIDLNDDDDDLDDGFTAEELDELCGDYDDCDDCPGFFACCEQD
jgi:Rha family phage regulatory protein